MKRHIEFASIKNLTDNVMKIIRVYVSENLTNEGFEMVNDFL